MKYLLNTNTCIRYINGRSPEIRTKFRATPLQEITVSIITIAELFYGSAKSQTPERSRQKQLDFLAPLKIVYIDEKTANAYGEIRAQLDTKGTPIGANDLLIAACAVANNLIVVTNNTREFARIENLKIENWEV